MFYPGCIGKIAEILPLEKTKIIVLLRNPILRAESHYYKTRRMGFENLSLQDAFIFEKSRMAQSDFGYREYSYFERGRYFKQIKKIYDVFPNENIKIYIFEELIKNQQEILDDICNFINLKKIKIKSIHSNKSYDSKLRFLNRLIRTKKKKIKKYIPQFLKGFLVYIVNMNKKDLVKEKIDNVFYSELIDYYSQDIKKLSDLIKIDLIDKWGMYKR